MNHRLIGALSRRTLLRTGGVMTLGAVVAGCGDRETSDAPGRVGAVPPATDLPTGEIDDVALLRTAQSLEDTAIELYAALAENDLVAEAYATPFDELVNDHQGHADRLASLIAAAGGEEYPCANPWIMERGVAPILQNILGDAAADIPISDDPRGDAVTLALAFENLAGASHQSSVGKLREPDLRAEVMMIGADEVRHAAVIAMLRTGTPKAYVSPQMFGSTEEEADEEGSPPYVLTSSFGQLGAIPLVVGAPNDAGTRFSATLETPAENSIIYQPMTCERS